MWDEAGSTLIATGNPYAVAAGAILKLTNTIASMFGIGRGRMEADMIVPVQNELHYGVLAPAVKEKDDPSTSLSRLRDLRVIVATALQKFSDFLHHPRWAQDGDVRAANQAHQTILGTDLAGNPGGPGYGAAVLRDIDKAIAARDIAGGLTENTGAAVALGLGALGLLGLLKGG